MTLLVAVLGGLVSVFGIACYILYLTAGAAYAHGFKRGVQSTMEEVVRQLHEQAQQPAKKKTGSLKN